MWSTYPVIGTLAAMIGGGAYVTFQVLAQRYQLIVTGRTGLATGLAFWPQVVGVLITATLLGVLLRSRFLPILTLAGMLLLIAGGALLLALPSGGSHPILLAANGLLGLGAGATVSPGLFLAVFPQPSRMVGRTFAIVELVRSEADFILAPVMVEVARIASAGGHLTLAGIHLAIAITLFLTIATTLFGIVLYLAGAGRQLPRADLEDWLERNRTAFESPPFGAARKRWQR